MHDKIWPYSASFPKRGQMHSLSKHHLPGGFHSVAAVVTADDLKGHEDFHSCFHWFHLQGTVRFSSHSSLTTLAARLHLLTELSVLQCARFNSGSRLHICTEALRLTPQAEVASGVSQIYFNLVPKEERLKPQTCWWSSVHTVQRAPGHIFHFMYYDVTHNEAKWDSH